MDRALRLSLVGLFACGLYFALRFGWLVHDVGLETLHFRKLCTLLAALAMMGGAAAAWRGWTWGLLLALMSSSAMLGAMCFGIADARFLPPVAFGAVALVSAARTLWRAERGAALAALALTLALGGVTALLAGPLYAPLRQEIDSLGQPPPSPLKTTEAPIPIFI